jgi:hypothetical protein
MIALRELCLKIRLKGPREQMHPHALTSDGLDACASFPSGLVATLQANGGRQKIIAHRFPRNPLKRPISDERIQGNPSFSKRVLTVATAQMAARQGKPNSEPGGAGGREWRRRASARSCRANRRFGDYKMRSGPFLAPNALKTTDRRQFRASGDGGVPTASAFAHPPLLKLRTIWPEARAGRRPSGWECR